MKNRENVKVFWTLLVALYSIPFFPMRAISQQTPNERSNVLIVIADDWGMHASAYGTPWISTPAFDRIAREGLLFRNAFTPNAKCAPSRAILLTGRHSWQLEDAGNHMAFFPTKFSTFPEAFSRSGIRVGTTGKGWAPGVANDENGKPREICGKPFQNRKQAPPTKAISNNDYAANFDDFLDSSPSGTPWCFWAGGMEPHRAYEYGSGNRLASKPITSIDKVPSYWPDNETIRNDMLDYALEVEHFDRHLDRMYKSLERRNLLDSTIIIVTSDHGMPFPRVKGQAYIPSNKIPLAIRWGNKILKPGTVIEDYVNFTDIAPTLFDLLDVDSAKAGMQPMSGSSLRPIFTNTKELKEGTIIDPARDHVVVGMERHDAGRPHDWGYPIRGIVKGSYFYLHNFASGRFPAGNPETGYLNCDGGATKSNILASHRSNRNDPFWKLCFGHRPSEELYDFSKDPDCVENLAGRTSHAAAQRSLQDLLHRDLVEQGDPRILEDGSLFDAYPIATKDSRNFYDRFMSGQTVKAGWVEEDDYERDESIIRSPSAPPTFPIKLNTDGSQIVDQHGQPFRVVGQILPGDYFADQKAANQGAASVSGTKENRWEQDLDDQSRRGINAVLIKYSNGTSNKFALPTIKDFCKRAQAKSISVWIECSETTEPIDTSIFNELTNVVWIRPANSTQTIERQSSSSSIAPVTANQIDATKIQYGPVTIPILLSHSDGSIPADQASHKFRKLLWNSISSNSSGFFIQLEDRTDGSSKPLNRSDELRDIARFHEIIGGMTRTEMIKAIKVEIEVASGFGKSMFLVEATGFKESLFYIPHMPDTATSIRVSKSPKTVTWIDPTNGERWAGVPEDDSEGNPYKPRMANAQGDHDWLVITE